MQTWHLWTMLSKEIFTCFSFDASTFTGASKKITMSFATVSRIWFYFAITTDIYFTYSIEFFDEHLGNYWIWHYRKVSFGTKVNTLLTLMLHFEFDSSIGTTFRVNECWQQQKYQLYSDQFHVYCVGGSKSVQKTIVHSNTIVTIFLAKFIVIKQVQQRQQQQPN